MPNKKLLSNLPACPVEVTLLLLSNKWTILILRDLFTGTKRFGELKKSLNGVSQKVLTANLRSLEEKGIIEREIALFLTSKHNLRSATSRRIQTYRFRENSRPYY